MAARAITPPYTVFNDADGTPLEAGFVYIGTAGLNPEVNPINVYLDPALTIPVARPIRTLAGYPSANGRPAQLYVDFVNYSITIRDKNGVLVVTAQNAAQILTAGNITNVPSGNIASTNVQSALDELDSHIGDAQGFRLSLTTAVPVTTSDVTGATSVYAVPYKGNRISLYDGTKWVTRTSAEFSIAIGTLASATIPQDIFCYDDAGTPTLELLPWTSTTARATALAYQDGVLVRNGDTTRRYLGSFCPTSTTTTEDSVLNRFLWNYYHRAVRAMEKYEATASWTYATADTWREVRGASNRLNFFVGVVEDSVKASATSLGIHSISGSYVYTGIGVNSTSVKTGTTGYSIVPSTTAGTSVQANAKFVPALGYNSVVWLERTNAATATFYGTLIEMQYGIQAEVMA